MREQKSGPAAPRGTPDKPWIFRTYAGHSTAAKSNELYRKNLAKGQTGLSIAFDLPTQTGYDCDHELATRRGRQGRRAGLAPRRHADAAGRHPARTDEHVDDDQRHGRLAAGALRRHRRRAGRAAHHAHGHDPERHHQGVPVARHLRVPARAVAAADQGHDRLHPRCHAEMEPDQRVLLPPAGGGATPVQELAFALATAQAVLDAVQGLRRGGARRLRPGGRAHLILRQRRAAGSSPRSARCAPSPSCGTRSRRALRRAPTPSTACSATACR